MSGTGKHQTSGILGLENALPHVIYDISLPFPERKEKAIVFKSASHLARHLGCSNDTVANYRVSRKRYKDKNGKEWAVRLATAEMIEKLKK